VGKGEFVAGQGKKTVLVATTNPGKLREIRGILEGTPIDLESLERFAGLAEPEETGATFAENAQLKALYYHQHTGLPAVADDSGIEIDALGGGPGVQSARWHGEHYPTKFEAIYRALAEQGLTTSPARFVAHIALAERGRIVFEARGTIEGEIAPEPRGTRGFGYDPIFFYPPYGMTLAEVEGVRKAAVSHRGKAFRQLAEYLSNLR
jgi:non-canonical purine NTP pyrophosphatase (RdgB/HAM1 family)